MGKNNQIDKKASCYNLGYCYTNIHCKYIFHNFNNSKIKFYSFTLVTGFNQSCFVVAGCYALPPEDSLTAVAITGTNLKNLSSFCRTSCLAKSSHYFYIQQNNTCQCIGKTPLGGNFTSFINGGTMTDYFVVRPCMSNICNRFGGCEQDH